MVPCPGEPQPPSIVFREGVVGREEETPPPCCHQKHRGLKLCHRYTVEYYAAMKKNEISPSAAVWQDWKVIMVGAISQTAKDLLYVESNVTN